MNNSWWIERNSRLYGNGRRRMLGCEWTGEYDVPDYLFSAFHFMRRRMCSFEGISIDRFIMRAGREDTRIVWIGPDEIIDARLGPADLRNIEMGDPWAMPAKRCPLIFACSKPSHWPLWPPVELDYFYNLRPLAGGRGKLLIRSLRDVVETANYWES